MILKRTYQKVFALSPENSPAIDQVGIFLKFSDKHSGKQSFIYPTVAKILLMLRCKIKLHANLQPD